jgi:hypothetical protein
VYRHNLTVGPQLIRETSRSVIEIAAYVGVHPDHEA